MNNSELWSQYRSYTEEFSKFSRQLGFAAAAICWFFKSDTVTFPTLILLALIFLMLFFMVDVLQYFVSAHRLRSWTRAEEIKMYNETGSIEGDYPKPAWLDRPAFIFFNMKAILLFAGYFAISIEFICRI